MSGARPRSARSLSSGRLGISLYSARCGCLHRYYLRRGGGGGRRAENLSGARLSPPRRPWRRRPARRSRSRAVIRFENGPRSPLRRAGNWNFLIRNVRSRPAITRPRFGYFLAARPARGLMHFLSRSCSIFEPVPADKQRRLSARLFGDAPERFIGD